METVKARLRPEPPGWQSAGLTIAAYMVIVLSCSSFIIAGIVLSTDGAVVTTIEPRYSLGCEGLSRPQVVEQRTIISTAGTVPGVIGALRCLCYQLPVAGCLPVAACCVRVSLVPSALS